MPRVDQGLSGEVVCCCRCRHRCTAHSLVGVKVDIRPVQVIQVLLAVEGVATCLPVAHCIARCRRAAS